MSRLRHLIDRLTGRADADLDREIASHLEAEADEQADRGLARHAEARDAARRAFGNVTLAKEHTRDAWGWTRVEQVLQDIRYAVRTLRRSPVFAGVAVVSLALGIGANATIFTFLNSVVLRPLPYPDPDRIVFIQERPLNQDKTVNVHPYNFLQWQARARSFESMALAQMIPNNTMGPDGAEQVPAMMTTPDLFRVLGLSPYLGRWFNADDARVSGLGGAGPIVIVSYEFWQRRMGSDPAAVGSLLRLNNRPTLVVGVTPPRFRVGTLAPDLYVPLVIDPAKPDSIGSRSFMCFARVRPDRDAVAARAEMTAIAVQLQHETELDSRMGVSVLTLRDWIVQSSRRILSLLMGVVAMVLLIACLNLASLLLTRGVGRQHELAIRASLGAGRLRLVQQLVIESLVLSAAGGALGLLVAQISTRVLLAMTKTALTFGRLDEVQIDWRVLAFTIALSTATALLCGLLPAWSVCRVAPQATLRDRGRGGRSGSARHTRFRSALVIGEVALAVVLLVGSGLLLRTFSKLLQVQLGFAPEHVLTMRLFLPDKEEEKRINTVDRILERVGALPDVGAVSTIKFLPVAGGTSGTGVRIGTADNAGGPPPWQLTEVSLVSRGYFATMGVPLVEGRAFDARDRLHAPRVVIVSQQFVRRYFPDGHALGKRITVQWEDEVPSEIIGVVGDVSYNELTTGPRAMAYLLHEQSPGYITHLVIRTSGDPASIAASVRRAVQAVDPTKAVSDLKTMTQYVDENLARPRLYASMLVAFAALALLLAGIGLYGLMAYGVSQRTHEIGIRMALGAQRSSVTRAVLFQGAWLALAGLAIGIISAAGLTRLLESLLFGVSPTDAATFAVVAVILGGVALLATFLPARRAARVDPMVALRCD